ncbi:MAG: hypothetical protein AAB618_01230 [Patescibacteria group bacterium]
MRGMKMSTPEELDFPNLSKEYRVYIDNLKRKWLAKNRYDSRDVYEIMPAWERSKVQGRIRQWGDYITPLAEAWWGERGYRIEWPTDDSKPVRLFKLEVV